MSLAQKRRALALLERINQHLRHRLQPTCWEAIYAVNAARRALQEERCSFLYEGRLIYF